MHFYCIADEDTVRGFRLAGIPGQAVSHPNEGAKAFAWGVSQPDCEILILTEDVAASLGPQLEAFRLEHARPLLVEIPGPRGPATRGGNLRQLVRSAVGSTLERES